jgi:hypothetical protein
MTFTSALSCTLCCVIGVLRTSVSSVLPSPGSMVPPQPGKTWASSESSPGAGKSVLGFEPYEYAPALRIASRLAIPATHHQLRVNLRVAS